LAIDGDFPRRFWSQVVAVNVQDFQGSSQFLVVGFQCDNGARPLAVNNRRIAAPSLHEIPSCTFLAIF
jgi:hypothetical protein